MNMQTFNWVPRIEPVGQFSHRTLTAKFGDGYAQTADDGINPGSQSWPLEFFGVSAYIQPIKQFLDQHRGSRAFLWTPPMGQPTAWLIGKGYTLQPHGADLFTLAVTFEEFNRP